MGTLKNFADGVRLALNINSQDAPVDVDERTIIWVADKVRNSLLVKYTKAYGIDSIGSFAIGQYFDVKIDANRDLKYVDTQGKIVSLGGNLGLLSVGRTQEDDCPFLITKPAQQGIYSKLEVGQNPLPQVWQEGGRLYFKNLPFGIKQVLVRAVPSFPSMNIDDQMPIPDDLVNDVMMEVMKLVMGNGSEDKPNDNNDNKQTIKA